MEKEKKTRNRKKGWLIALIVVFSLILVAVLAATLFVNSLLNRITRADTLETLSPEVLESIQQETDPYDPEFTGPMLDATDVTEPEDPFAAIPTDSDNIINILLVGQDGYGTGPTVRSRSDSMILCTFNKSTKTLTMTSFMRDMYVKIPGYYSQRINVAYAVGGFPALYDTLEYNFGIRPDYGVAVNFATFKEVIDMVGGVDIELTAAEARKLNNEIVPHYGHTYNWGLTEGVQHLNGTQALLYARNRSIGDDFARTERQRNVIDQLVQKAKNLPLSDLYEMVNTLLPHLVTDMSNAEIIKCAVECAPYLKDIQIVSQRIPINGSYRHVGINGMRVLLPDLEENHQFLVDTIGITTKEEETE